MNRSNFEIIRISLLKLKSYLFNDNFFSKLANFLIIIKIIKNLKFLII
jgi:hypothetical protein